MKRFFTALLFALGLTVLFTVAISAESKTAVFYNGDKVYATTEIEDNSHLTLPSCATTGKFVGWVTETDSGEVLYPAGTTLALDEGETVFRALAVDLRTLTGAAVSTNAPTTLRFDGAISLADYSRLVELVGSGRVSFGLLIAPTTRIYGAQTDSTKFQKTSDVPTMLDRTSSAFAYSTAAYGVFSGRTDVIADAQLLESYSARAYMTVVTAEGEITVYADYDPAKHDRMAHFVTAMAFEDRTEQKDDSHIHTTATVTDHYSLYPASTLDALEARLDQVISVSQWNSDTQSVEVRVVSEYAKNIYGGFTAFNFYTSPYRVDRVLDDTPAGYDTYVIVGENGADFNNVKVYFIGHSYRPPSADEWRSDGIYIAVRNETGAPF